MDAIIQAATAYTARVLSRYLIGALTALGMLASEAIPLVEDPAVEKLLVALIGGLLAWGVEKLTEMARQAGRPT